MICPACKHQMLVVEYQKIELDYCQNCKGVWFDSGELDLLLDAESPVCISSMLKSAEGKTSEAKRRCPICHQTMKKSHAGEQPPVLIDVCPQGDGIWFDGGEVVQLAKQVGKARSADAICDTKVISFMEEVFQAPDKK